MTVGDLCVNSIVSAHPDDTVVEAARRMRARHVGDIVVADNVATHKVAGVAEAIEAAGATLRYLPPYSPDLNPIEMPFSKFKAYLRKLAQRTIPGIRRGIRSFLSSLKGQECANYLRHAGYASI